MLINRIRHLEKEHERLSKETEMLERTGRFTDSQLHELKKQKLAIKDELSMLRRQEYEERQRVNIDDEY